MGLDLHVCHSSSMLAGRHALAAAAFRRAPYTPREYQPCGAEPEKSPQHLVLALQPRCSRMAPVTRRRTTREGKWRVQAPDVGGTCGPASRFLIDSMSRIQCDVTHSKQRIGRTPIRHSSKDPSFPAVSISVKRNSALATSFAPEQTEATWIGDHSSALERSRLAH